MDEVYGNQRVMNSPIIIGAMHVRLIAWGRICIVGGRGAAQRWDSDTPRKRIDFSPAQIDAAYRLHLMVGQLSEIQQRLLLPEFYSGIEVEVWDGLTPMRRSAIIAAMIGSINIGIRKYARDARRHIHHISAMEFEIIRYRALRMLVTRESVACEQHVTSPHGKID